ncbi:MAG: hypothetical protein FJ104_17060, partial [Deltaproteobacteria bacterium]|nr:hypothetical protein [Deltaproteobacteria bacterium]
EPRAHAAAEDYTLTYEGLVIGERGSARVEVAGATIELEDGAASLCAAGVEDEGFARTRASGLAVADADVDAFARRHADFVTITSDLLPSDDAWWRGRGATCGGADPAQERAGYLQCRAQLGTRSAPVEWRELRVVDASRDRLVLAPRAVANEAEASYVRELIGCCFPQAVSYTVRASHEWVLRGSRSGVRHGIATGLDGRCERTCDASRAGLDSRAFEVACRSDEGCPRDATGARAIGLAAQGDVACLVDEGSPGGLALDDLLVRGRSGCVFQGLTTSFSLYRAPAADGAGAGASARDLQFSWSVVGGFSPFVIGLSTQFEGSVTPASITPAPSGALLVPDGASRGLLVVDTDTFSVSTIF